MERKRVYNPNSEENLNERKVFNGNPHGILNFTKAKYTWALKLWDIMEANTWFPKEVDTTKDVLDYKANLTSAEKRMYDLVWSQLISMDSFQTNNLIDNINPYITAPEINAILARQAYEEANHSKSYAVMVEAICDNTDLIYEMEKHDETLREKNDFISNVMIVSLHNTDELHDLPEAETSEYKKDEMQLVLTLSENQVPSAVNWLMELIRQGKVLNYKLTSATLDMQYGGMINGE